MSMDLAPQSPIPPGLKDLLDLFEGPLAGVPFPDVDAATLREHAAAVDAAAHEVEVAAAAWAAAKRSVDDRLEALAQKAQRALAYARIYADGKPDLQAALARVALPPSGPAAAPAPQVAAARKRGRPRKVPVSAPDSERVITLLPEATADLPEATTEESAAAE